MVYISEDDVRNAFDPQTFARGWNYQKTGKVLQILVSFVSKNEYLVEGIVQGSRRSPYKVSVEIMADNLHVSIFGECSCPVEVDCKHAVAILMEAIKGNHFKDNFITNDETIEEGWLKNLSKKNLPVNSVLPVM